MYGIADLDNCYVSCERVFRPDLVGKPVVVLSNNDGMIVARSNISKETPAYFRYSIDECFMYLDGIELNELQQWGENLHKRVKREVGMPISIGLAPTKTLAKIASKLAKKYEVYKHCCMIDTDYKREKALEWCPIEDVWGIGRRYAAKLQSLGCKTALDFAKHHQDWVRLTFNNINIVRTWQELNGEDAVPNEQLAKKTMVSTNRQSICTSRSFDGMISDIEGLKTQVSNYAARCAEKLRQQNTVASIVGVFLNTNAFREDLAQYWNFRERPLITPSSSTITIVQAANDVLQSIYRPGYQYKKAGVVVMGIGPDSPIQQDLFDINAEQFQKMKRLDEVVDRINRMHGSETIVLGSQQYISKEAMGKAAIEREQNQAGLIPAEREQARMKFKADVFANAIKHDFKSKNPTTRWADIVKIR